MPVSNERSDAAAALAERELVFSRVFDAPRALVFKAWTQANHVAGWFGPDGFTTTTHEMDVRPGGVWRFTMHGPDGRDYPNHIVYLEVVPPERLRYRHSSGAEGDAGFEVTVDFVRRGAATELTMRMLFASAAERDRIAREFGAIEGAHQTLNRLAEHLLVKGSFRLTAEPDEPTIVITRLFDAPRRLVFEAYTRPEHLVHWFGCDEAPMSGCQVDLRPGGTYRFALRLPGGGECTFDGEYREIAPPVRLVYTQRFNGDREAEAVVTTTLVDEGGRTRLTETILARSVEHRDRLLATGLDAGAEEALDRLERVVQGMA